MMRRKRGGARAQASPITGLERRYRRLLTCYPREHRQAHEDEMAGVLLAGAREGQRWPGLAESADLITGAVRIRLRSLSSGPRDARWRDALAIVSVVAPVLLLADGLATAGVVSVVIQAARGSFEKPFWLASWWVWPQTVGPVITVALMLLKRGRPAALAALAATVSEIVIRLAVSGSYLQSAGVSLWLCLGGLAAFALAAAPGPRRGLQILRWWGLGAVAAGGLVMAALAQGNLYPEVLQQHAWLIIASVLAVVTAACLVNPVARRVVALLAIPAVTYVLPAWVLTRFHMAGAGGWTASLVQLIALYLAPMIVVCAIIGAMCRERRRARRLTPAPRRQ